MQSSMWWCNVICDVDKSNTYLKQIYYTEEILRPYNIWNGTSQLTSGWV